MHSLTICFGRAGTVWNLLYKDAETAQGLFDTLLALKERSGQYIKDDFGQQIVIDMSTVTAMLLEDLDASQQGQIERGLHNARSQAKAQQRAMADPAIRTAAMAQGPAVLSGGMPPGARFNG